MITQPKFYVLKPWAGKTSVKPGTWVQLGVVSSRTLNEIVAFPCTNSNVPFGILVDLKYVNGVLMAGIDTTIGGVWETDVIDFDQKFPVNAMLFVQDGYLTTRKPIHDGYDGYYHDGYHDGYDGYYGDGYGLTSLPVAVGFVTRPPTGTNPVLEFFRIG